MRNRILSIVLCLALLLTAFPFAVPEVRAAEKGLTVTCGGEEITEISLTQEEKKTLTANAVGLDVLSYSWQILAEAEPELWVDIEDMTEESMDVSLATVKSVFDDAGNAYIRCAVECADGEVFSAPVRVSEEVPTEYVDPPHVTAYEVGLPTLVEEEKPMTFAAMRKTARAGNIETVTITIQYLDFATMGGTEAAIYTPYTATIEKGGEFKDDITSPTFLGFAPYYDADDPIDGKDYTDDASKVVLNLPNVQEDVVIKVWYKAVEVPFAVKFFFQNINDDLYTERTDLYHQGEALTGTIIENDFLEGLAGHPEGFSKLYHIPESVAADGSTVFECYYDRNYYLIQFDLNGGYGVDPIYGRYGAPYIVNDPIRHGWVFQGWDLMDVDSDADGKPDDYDGNINVMPGTIPAANCYYRAVWATTQTTYKVVYWAQSPDDPDTLIPESLKDTPSASGDPKATLEYLGSREVAVHPASHPLKGQPVKSDDEVNGENDLEKYKDSMYACGKDEHDHVDACYGNCDASSPHTHLRSCYTNNDFYQISSGSTAETYLNILKDKLPTGEPQNGYFYKYLYRSTYNSTYYNYFYIENTWHYVGTGNTTNGINVSITNPSGDGQYTSAQATPKCGSTEHTHTQDCLSCKLEEHKHVDSCKKTVDMSQLEFYDCDKQVKVEGDGSTVVNVYYRYKKYSLRFIYAKEKTSDGSIHVVGGTTWPFGTYNKNANANTPLSTLLGYVTEWCEVKTKVTRVTQTPVMDGDVQETDAEGNKLYYGTVEDLVQEKYTNYTVDGVKQIRLGSYSDENLDDGDDYNGFKYHYIEFDARFGQCLEELWPIGKFNAAYIEGDRNKGQDYVLPTAYFSAWNGEYKVKYSQDNSTRPNANKGKVNETIKGCYMYLDENLLYQSGFDYTKNGEGKEALSESGAKIVNYLGFWDNGANIKWSVPRLWLYKLYIEKNDGSGEYELYKYFETYDDGKKDKADGQTPSSIEGFEYRGYTVETGVSSDDMDLLTPEANLIPAETSKNGRFTISFYYDRIPYDITFNSKNEVVETVTDKDFGTSMSMFADENDKDYVDVPYPDTLEEGAYFFDGWYTTPGCFDGSEFDLNTDKMTPYDLALYAKWSPETHTVSFYPTYNDMQSETNCHYTKDVLHGQVVGTVDNPTNFGDGNMELIFAGWFYMDNGVKKAFSPLDMAVTESLDVFADWSSSMPQPYKISYVLQSDKNTKVADDTTGFAYGGSTRTFVAKAGDPYNQLYPTYNTGYFPTVASHSITMQYEPDKDNPTKNKHVFEYVQAQNIKYTVNYINVDTGKIMKTEEHTTSKAVETVRFKAFENMVPDAFYKRLVVAVELKDGQYVGSESNVVNFYYSPNTTKAYYAVHYLREKVGATDDQLSQYKIDGSGGYELSTTHVEGIGDIGKNIDIVPQNIDGFTLIADDAVARYTIGGENEKTIDLTDGKYSITIDAKGTELYMFYQRNSYPFTVNYFLYNTKTPVNAGVAPTENGSMKYGHTLTRTAKDVPGFTCVSAQTTQSITIRDKEAQNVINFYYAPVEYVVEYIPVVNGEIPDDVAGWLDRSIEVVDGSVPFEGATPSTSEHYKFDGWYLDEACTVEVGVKATVDSETKKLTPNKANLSETESNKFYAKFTRLAGDFTITRENAADNKQVFVYQVRNKTTNEELFVTVQGNGSVTIAGLPYGNYTVTQLNGWSWHYGDTMAETEHDGGIGSSVTFNDSASGKWLSGSSNLKHNVKGG